MDSLPLFLPPLLLHCTILLLLIQVPSCLSSNDDYYSNCSNLYNCGNLTNIGFPFWGDNRPNMCGHPLLQLNCQNNQTYINIKDVKYKVLDAKPYNQTLRIARVDYLQSMCPQNPLNTTLDPWLFDYEPNYKNLTFFYGCQDSKTYPTYGFASFPCSKNGENVYAEIEAEDPPMPCASSVDVPVSASLSSLDIWNSSKVQEALSYGFEVRWKVDLEECHKCENSNGVCGYLNSTQPTCYCKSLDSGSTVCRLTIPIPPAKSPQAQGHPPAKAPQAQGHPLPFPLPGKKKKSKVVIVGAGIAVGVAALASILIGGCVYLKRRKRMLERSQSQDPFMPPSSNATFSSSYTTNMSTTISSYLSSMSNSMQRSYYFGVHVFSYAELEEGTKNFDPSRQLGEGGFGTVYFGTLKDGRCVAVKRLHERTLKQVDQFLNEIEILARLQHKNLVTLYGCTSRRSHELLLVYEYIPNGTLSDHLHGKRTKSKLLAWQVRLKIAVETAEALAYLHASDVIHRDVKSNNILLDDKFGVKVADFGLSRLFPNDVTHVSTAPQGTPGYVDPEYYQCYQLTDKSDVYSFGVVLVELMSSLPAVDITRHRHDVNLANMALSRIQNHALHELVDPCLGFESDYAVRQMITAVAELAFRCLQEIDMRPTMEEVLKDLRGIQNGGYHTHNKAEEVVDISTEEIMLLEKGPSPPSPDSDADNS